APRSTRWNWQDWHWNWRPGAAATCASSTRRRPAWPGGCGRSRSGWSHSVAPRSTRWNWQDWHWNWRPGAAATCASSTRRRP
ncbi:hypothetical protein C7E24_22090, partial [Stenotrophomonas maltophilia]